MTTPTYCQFARDHGRVFKCGECGYKWTSRRDDDVTPVRLCGPVGTCGKHRLGPGDVLHRLIRWLFGEDHDGKCECKKWINKMNAWGWRSILHAGEIAGKMQAEAIKRGWKLAKTWPKTTRLGCRGLVVLAVCLSIATSCRAWVLRRRSFAFCAFGGKKGSGYSEAAERPVDGVVGHGKEVLTPGGAGR